MKEAENAEPRRQTLQERTASRSPGLTLTDRPTTAYGAAVAALRRAHKPSHYDPTIIAEPSLNRACGQLIFLCLFHQILCHLFVLSNHLGG